MNQATACAEILNVETRSHGGGFKRTTKLPLFLLLLLIFGINLLDLNDANTL